MMSVISALINLLMLVDFSLSRLLTAGEPAVMDLIYCRAAGCAANVTKVFFEDQIIFENNPIPDCSGAPALKSVCQYDGRAFVSTPKGVRCDFEGLGYNIPSNTCSERDPICCLPPAPTSPPVTSDGVGGTSVWTIIGFVFLVIICLILVVGLPIYCCRRHRCNKNPAVRNPAEAIPLGEIQIPGDISEQSSC